MGQVYWGPYAGQLAGGCHEGYAAIELPNGELTAVWPGDTVVLAQVAACDCGWHGSTRYPADYDGEEAAVEEWRDRHLTPLIAEAARTGWPAWAGRVTRIAIETAQSVRDGDLELAATVMTRLRDEVQVWARVLDELIEEASR